MRKLIFAFIVVFACGTPARAGNTELGFTLGASQIQVSGSDPIDSNWGPYFELSITTAPIASVPQFRVGGGIGFSYFREDDIDVGFFGTIDEQWFLFTPEFLVSWRQPLGQKFFIEPGLGVGGVIGAVDAFGTEWGGGYSVRPFVRAGIEASHGSFGIDVSYRFGHLDFDGGGGDIQNLSIGAFFNFKL